MYGKTVAGKLLVLLAASCALALGFGGWLLHGISRAPDEASTLAANLEATYGLSQRMHHDILQISSLVHRQLAAPDLEVDRELRKLDYALGDRETRYLTLPVGTQERLAVERIRTAHGELSVQAAQITSLVRSGRREEAFDRLEAFRGIVDRLERDFSLLNRIQVSKLHDALERLRRSVRLGRYALVAFGGAGVLLLGVLMVELRRLRSVRGLRCGVAWGLALLAACSQVGCATDAAPIRIAVALSSPTPIGAALAAREINAAGGVRGRSLELVGSGLGGSEPISTRPEEVLVQAERFATDPSVVAVVGHSDSRSTLTASAVYNQHRLPQLVTIATHPEITGIGDWTYRLCLSDAEQGPALARYAFRDWGRRRAAVFHVNDDYGRGLASRFQQEFEDLGGEIVASVPHRDELGPDDEALLRREIERLRQAGEPDLIALFQRVDAATWTVRALHRAGLRSAILGGDNLGRTLFLQEEPELKEGLRVSQFFVADAGRPRARRFVRAFRELAGEAPDYGSAFAYDAVYLLRDALEQGGVDRRAVKEYLDRAIADERPIQGAAGPFILDAAHDARRPLYVVEIRDGSFRLLTTLLADAVAPGNDPAASP